MIIISQFILHSTLAFHTKEPAIESSIVFLLKLMHIRAYSKRSGSTTVSRRQSRVSSHHIEYRVEYRDSILDSQHSRVSRTECHLTSGRYCIWQWGTFEFEHYLNAIFLMFCARQGAHKSQHSP